MRTNEIDVYRDGNWWMVNILEIDGLTQARWPGENRRHGAHTSPSAPTNRSTTLPSGSPDRAGGKERKSRLSNRIGRQKWALKRHQNGSQNTRSVRESMTWPNHIGAVGYSPYADSF
jgi:hypothetical protein